jgi:hypothetical protein
MCENFVDVFLLDMSALTHEERARAETLVDKFKFLLIAESLNPVVAYIEDKPLNILRVTLDKGARARLIDTLKPTIHRPHSEPNSPVSDLLSYNWSHCVAPYRYDPCYD